MYIEQLRIPAMQSRHDARRISTTLECMPGVVRVQVALEQHAVRVDHDGRAQLSRLIAAIQRLGYQDVAAMA